MPRTKSLSPPRTLRGGADLPEVPLGTTDSDSDDHGMDTSDASALHNSKSDAGGSDYSADTSDASSADSPSELSLPTPSRHDALQRRASKALDRASAGLWGRVLTSSSRRKHKRPKRSIQHAQLQTPSHSEVPMHPAIQPRRREGGIESTAAGALSIHAHLNFVAALGRQTCCSALLCTFHADLSAMN